MERFTVIVHICICLLQLTNDVISNIMQPGECDIALETGMIAWEDNLAGSYINVTWGYEHNCNSEVTCFGFNMTVDHVMNVQLSPVEIQEGMTLRFIPSEVTPSRRLTMQPYKVDAIDFNSCSTAAGQPVISTPTSEPFIVDQQFLSPGSNFFIVNSGEIFNCRYGLRLNVTIKPNKCHFPHSLEGMYCMDNGICITHKTEGTYSCKCCEGFTGPHCDEYDGCINHMCAEGSTCLDIQEGYTSYGYLCQCPPGKSGIYCEVDVDECASDPCQHGVCVDELNGYQCYCIPGYTGNNCEIEYNECISSPCLNEGFCIDRLDGYECDCGIGYIGEHCEGKVDLCAADPCRNATVCVDYGNFFKCECAAGFRGSHCEININECESNPCVNGGRCRDEINSFTCVCEGGWEGIHCETEFDKSTPVEVAQHATVSTIVICFTVIVVALILVIVVVVWRYPRIKSFMKYKTAKVDVDNSEPPMPLQSISSKCRSRATVLATYQTSRVDFVLDPNEPLFHSFKPKKI
ncbi:fibropellin-1-like [Anneissia japonica]|uniref:fibropellin-1-like n=1 Tax=Anneissia japonica TaxID=1529436 RepID=UPI0014258898|nr:fibropellin-1-like [Anneissia japonica]